MRVFLKIFLFVFILCLIRGSLYAQDDALTEAGIRKVYEIFNSGDYSNLDVFIDENFVDHSPMEGQKQGLAGLKEIFEVAQGYGSEIYHQ
jgi:hypothetical protein